MSRMLEMLVYAIIACSQVVVALFLIGRYTHGGAAGAASTAVNIVPRGADGPSYGSPPPLLPTTHGVPDKTRRQY